MKVLDVEMEIDEFAEFMFKRNINNIPLELSIGGLENNKDIFYFCLDLFCKGLVILFSKDGKSVEVEQLCMDDFELVKKKMSCAGIQVSLNVLPTPHETINNEQITNLHEIHMDMDDRPLEDYKFVLNTSPYQYSITFSLFHNVL